MRYRSCKNGRVHEVILCERDGVYGRLRRKYEDGTYSEVVDVTDLIHHERIRDLSQEWTEVTLLGNGPKQNTVYDPYNGDPKCDSQWLATYLYHRFYRLPDGVKVFLHSGTRTFLENGCRFFSIPDRIQAEERLIKQRQF